MSHSFTPGRPRWWQWLTILSLDAPLVAVLWQALFARTAGVRLGWHDPVLLGLAVWIIYAADRWIEGWRLDPGSVRTQRHYFYIRWRWPVFAAGFVAFVVAVAVAIRHLGGAEFRAGLLLTIPILAYLFSHQLVHRHHPLRVPKELCIGVLFALGCVLAPAVQSAPEQRLVLITPTILFGLLCFANCALIAAWEKEVDALHGQTSLALQWTRGVTVIRSLPWLLCVAGIALFVSPTTSQPAAGCVAVSGLLFGLLDLAQPRIGRQAARAAIDVALMTPAVVLLLPQ